jgi:hypothetical protein
MQRVWTWDLVRHTRDMGSVVVAMARLVVAVGEDGEVALGMGASQFGFRTGVVERLPGSIHLEVKVVLLSAAQAFPARMALATVVMSLRLAFVLVRVLVLLVATVAFGVVGLGLARTATVFALLDGAALWVDMVQIAISVIATAHSVTLDAGRASPFFAIDNRHTGVATAECGRGSGLRTAGWEMQRAKGLGIEHKMETSTTRSGWRRRAESEKGK